MILLRSEIEFIKAMIPNGEELLNNLETKQLFRALFKLYFDTETYNSKQKKLRKLLRYIWWLGHKIQRSDELGYTEDLVIEEDIEITDEVKRKLEKLPVELKEFLRDKEWRDMFSPLMLYRAEKLSYNSIESIYRTWENTYYARVKGSDIYNVEVSDDFQRFSYICRCTCPYARREDYCKHMAAVLFYVERNREKILNEVDLTAEGEVHFYESLIDENGILKNANGFWITKEQITILKVTLSPREYTDLMDKFEEELEGEDSFLDELDVLSYNYELDERKDWRKGDRLLDLYINIKEQNEKIIKTA